MKPGLKISLIPLVLRRMGGVRTVASGAVNRPIPQDEFGRVCAGYQREAAANPGDLPGVVAGLWKSEGFATTFGKFRLPENTFLDDRIPRESLGITHVGYGAASTEHTLFDAAGLHEIANTKCRPEGRGFMYEGIGSILRIYEPGIFKFMCGMLGLIPRNAPPGPDKSGFFSGFMADFTPEVQWLITHGYGRLVAFSNMSVYRAIEEAQALPAERRDACIRGIAFAFAMMNAQELPRILEQSQTLEDKAVRRSFQNGLVYAIVFDDWFVPGCLDAWRPQAPLEEKLVTLARAESALNFKRGYPLPFGLENPL